MSPAKSGDKPVTRADIEAKLAEIRGVADQTAEAAEGAAKTGLVVGGVAVVVLAFLLGRRRGRKKSTIVEVRRI
jgi:MYXO-CTERM domain-containing protein